jgi:hypothetical protein
MKEAILAYLLERESRSKKKIKVAYRSSSHLYRRQTEGSF